MKKPKYLKHLGNNRVLDYTDTLAERDDVIPCDVEGNPLEGYPIHVRKPFPLPEVIHVDADGWGLGDSEKCQLLDNQLKEQNKEVKRVLQAINNSPYDGVMGSLPGWIQRRDQNRFKDARDLLLKHYTHEQVIEFLESLPRYMEGSDNIQFAQMSLERIRAIDYLVFIKRAADAKEIKGKGMLYGDDAARGYKDRKDKKRGADKANEPKEAAQNFCITEAAKWWAMEDSRGEQITRIGEVSATLWSRLASEGHWQPKKPDTVKAWIKTADKKGLLTIPEAAQKHGAQQK